MGTTEMMLVFIGVLVVSALFSFIYFNKTIVFDDETGESIPKKELKKRDALRKYGEKNRLIEDSEARIMWNLEKAVTKDQNNTKLLGQYRELIYQVRRLRVLFNQSDQIKESLSIKGKIIELETELYSKSIKELGQATSNNSGGSADKKKFISQAEKALNDLMNLYSLK